MVIPTSPTTSEEEYLLRSPTASNMNLSLPKPLHTHPSTTNPPQPLTVENLLLGPSTLDITIHTPPQPLHSSPPTIITNLPNPPTEEMENLSVHLPSCLNHRSRGGHRGGRCKVKSSRLSPLFPSAVNIINDEKRKRQTLTLSPTNISSTSPTSSPNQKPKSRKIEDLLGAP
ncbi:unnamed protein product [Meganyctiphanes norvegica]|uniref:Uncharacterized protein n=1 Tax=Meganyctiphanes norvegica TaxID=48144 RepID=A0AAV2R1U5_MEGNR